MKILHSGVLISTQADYISQEYIEYIIIEQTSSQGLVTGDDAVYYYQ